jgi:hypothetical protein
VYRHHFATRRNEAAKRGTGRPALEVAEPFDLVSLRLLLRQHVDDLRSRGADDDVLAPIEAQLRRYDVTVGELMEQTDEPRLEDQAAVVVRRGLFRRGRLSG